jgi:hypothetical protein
MPLAHLPKDMAWLTAVDHEVLGYDFDEIDRYGRLQKVTIVFLAQADAVA